MRDRPAGALWAELRDDFRRPALGATVVGGIVAGLIAVALTISFAAFVFRDALADDLRVGVGVVLAATVVLAVTTALGSGLPGAVAGVQEVTAAILGVAAARIAASAPDEQLGSVLAFMVAATLATGAFLWFLGRFRLGRLVRFVPLTVIGGFIASSGYLILTGAISILGASGDGSVATWAVVVPAIVLAVAMTVSERVGAPLVLFPVSIVGSAVVLQLGIWLSGTSVAEAADQGWLLGGPDSGALWTPAVLGEIANANISVVLGEFGGIATVALVAAMGLLLNLHSLETALGQDLDLDRELRVAGTANVLAAAVGGGPGFTYLSDTLLLARLRMRRRGAALVAGLVAAVALLIGPGLLVLVPTAVAAGLLLFLGVSFLLEWLWDSRRKLSLLDRTGLLGIVLVVAVFGLVQGIIVGLVMAVMLFVFRYSRIDVIQRTFDLTALRSRTDRSESQIRWLGEAGSRAIVMELRGYLFFGTADVLVDAVAGRVTTDPRLEWVILDMTGVTGLDATAADALGRIARAGSDQGCGLVLACSGTTRAILEGEGIFSGPVAQSLHFESDLDAAIGFCEDRLLDDPSAPEDQFTASLSDHLVDRMDRDAALHLASLFERVHVNDGDRIIQQGSPAAGLFFIEEGRLTAQLESEHGPPRRLLAMRAGAFVGEIALYGRTNATASVLAIGDATVARLSPEAFGTLRAQKPAVAAQLHEMVAETLIERLDRAEAATRQLRGS